MVKIIQFLTIHFLYISYAYTLSNNNSYQQIAIAIAQNIHIISTAFQIMFYCQNKNWTKEKATIQMYTN